MQSRPTADPQSEKTSEGGTPSARIYDFRRPQTLARDDARALEMALETFTRQWSNQLTQRLRTMAQINIETVEMVTYDEYVRGLPAMTAMILCTVEQARSNAVVQMPASMALRWVDYLLGGNGDDADCVEREFTEIETTLVRDLLDHALADIRYAFAGVMPLDMRVRSVQYNPQFVQVVAAAEQVIVTRYTMRIGETEEQATLMIPAEVLLAGLRSGDRVDNRTNDEVRTAAIAAERLSSTILDVPVQVSVRFAPQTLHAREVVDLGIGDVLPLRHPTLRHLDVVVDDVVLAHAAQGAAGSRLAAQITTKEKN